jgi:hypothetical protein
MNKRHCLLAGFVFINIAWQAVVWTRAFFSPIAGWSLICLLPIVAGIILFKLIGGNRGGTCAWVMVVAGGLVPVMYVAGTVTRLSDYPQFIERPDFVFSGPVAGIEDGAADFFSIRDFRHEKAKKEQFGFAYSLHQSKGSTRYVDHFVLPIFDTSEGSKPKLWAYESVPTIYVIRNIDDYIEFAKDGLELEAFRKQLRSDVVFGRKVDDRNAQRALTEYLSKFPVDDLGVPLMIELIDESPEHYFRIAAVHFWLMTAGLNFIFFGLCVALGALFRKPSEKLL